MTAAHSQSNKAAMFAAGWIARNIEIGPFSWNDPPIYDGQISDFKKAAAEAGLSEAELAQGIGPVPAFIAKAYSDANATWEADQKRLRPM